MSTYVIKWLKDKLGTRFFPVTHINAVRDDMGTSLASMLEAKQDTLVSGTNIKTVNNNSLLGSGNIDIQGGGGADVGTFTELQALITSASSGDVIVLDKDYKNVDAALEDSVGVAIKTEPDKAKVIKEIFRNEYMNE